MGQANAIPHSNGIVALSMISKETSKERSASKYVDFSPGSRGQAAMNCLSCDILFSKSTGSIALLCGDLQIFVSRSLNILSCSFFFFFSLEKFTLKAAYPYGGNHHETKASLEILVSKRDTV